MFLKPMSSLHISDTIMGRTTQIFTLLSFLAASIVMVSSDDSSAFYDPSMGGVSLRQEQPRLLELMQLKNSLYKPLAPPDFDQSDDSASSDEAIAIQRLSKRVFCNGFTGCGGKFRGRRRQQNFGTLANENKRMIAQVLQKRPFCGSSGCFKGVKRTSGKSFNLGVSSGNSRDDRWKNAASDDELSVDDVALVPVPTHFKRLFCNGYGGCQNLGKRLSSLLSNQDIESRRLINGSKFKILSKLPEAKRFFNSGVDGKIDALI